MYRTFLYFGIFALTFVFICLLVLFNSGCQTNQGSSGDNTSVSAIPRIANAQTEPEHRTDVSDESTESFVEELKIGTSGENKIEINCSQNTEGGQVKIRFYTKEGSWRLKQSLEFKKDDGLPCDPRFEDFNNDGLNDLTFISGTAARGANEIRTLLIYDKKLDELIPIKNSADYPNLAYNLRLDCIDAMLFYGGTATVFLKLKGDKLEEFASVEDHPPNRTVTVMDRNGHEKVIRRDKIADDIGFIRYKNFDPIEY